MTGRAKTNDVEPGVYTAAQMARVLGYGHVSQFNKLVAEGSFPVPPLNLPGHRRWSRAEVHAWLSSRSEAGAA